jgi:hypothetical protein
VGTEYWWKNTDKVKRKYWEKKSFPLPLCTLALGVGRRWLSFCDCATLHGGDSLKIAVLWHEIPCSSVEMYRLFRSTCCLYLQSRWQQVPPKLKRLITCHRSPAHKIVLNKWARNFQIEFLWVLIVTEHVLVGTHNTLWLVPTIRSSWYPKHVLAGTHNTFWLVTTIRSDWYLQYVLVVTQNTSWLVPTTRSGCHPQHFLVVTHNTFWLFPTIRSGWYPRHVLAVTHNTFWLLPTTFSGCYTQYVLVVTHNTFWFLLTTRSG